MKKKKMKKDKCYEKWLDEHDDITDDEIVQMAECMEEDDIHKPTEDELIDLY